MPKPLQLGDPGELGPFRLDSRLAESPAGIVYLGSDPSGRPVEVALLTTSAAGDAAARDRFRAAVSAETARPGPGEGSPVLASLTEGAAPWVATAYEEGRSGAERFLEPVLLKRGWGGVRHRRGGPQFQPYWLSGPRGPALQPVEPAGAPEPAGDTRGLATAVISLAALLALLALLVVLLFSCEPKDPKPPQPTPPPVPTQPAVPLPPPSPSVRPTPSKSGSPAPHPTDSGGQGTENPAGVMP